MSRYHPPQRVPGRGLMHARPGSTLAALERVAAYHSAHESEWPRSMYSPRMVNYVGTAPILTRNRPYNTVIGPVKERGPPAGMLLKGGWIVEEWGDIDRPDMTFSVAKSFLRRARQETRTNRARGLIRSIERTHVSGMTPLWMKREFGTARITR